MTVPALQLDGLRKSFGKTEIIRGIDLSIGKAERHAVIGPNGAGKSTLFNLITARFAPSAGTVKLHGEDLAGLEPFQINRKGLSRSFQITNIFPAMSVAENLALGAFPERARGDAAAQRMEVFDLFPKLAERRDQIAGTMSGGEQQMVAIGRALMSAPDLLLLDEPSLGLAPVVTQGVFCALERIRATGLTVLIVEQNARATLALADRAYLIEAGRIIGSGRAEELRNDPAVVRAFLGGAAAGTS